MIYMIQSTANPLFGIPVVDAHVYAQWASRMADGVWLWDQVENYLPIYPAFLALQQIIFGVNPFVSKILQSLMGALTAVMMAQVAARAWNRQVGLIAGYLIATYWMLVIFGAEKYAETFSIFFQGLTIWLLIRYRERCWAILAAGISFALAAGVRANLFLILPFILFWLAWRYRRQRMKGVTAIVLFSIGTVLIIGPIVVRNYQISGSPMLRAQASWSLYSGLSPEFEGLHPPVGILFEKYMHLPNQNGAFNEKEIEAYWYHRLSEVIRENPSGVLLNFLRHLVIFANAREWSQEFDVYAYRNYSSILSLPWTGFWLIGPFGLLGLVLTRRLSKDQLLILIFTIIGIISILPFKASDRYRLPSAVLLALFAALALWNFFQWSKNRNWRVLLTVAPLLVLACLLCWPDWQNLETRKSARHHFFIGWHYECSGRLEDAIRAYEKSMREFPWDPDSPHRIGRILIRQNRPDQAMEFLRLALQRESEFPEVLNAIADIYLQKGALAAAEKELNISLRLAPANVEAFLLMANLQHRKGQNDAEIVFLKKAVANSANHKPAMLLALRFKEAGSYREAIKLYDRVMTSRKVAKKFRLAAAMQAGMLIARFSDKARGAVHYWRYIIKEFNEFKFFSSQAAFLVGDLDEKSLREQLGDTPEKRAAAEYVIGLRHRIKGDTLSAIEAYRRCLQVDIGDQPINQGSPQTWAREDLQHLVDAQK